MTERSHCREADNNENAADLPRANADEVQERDRHQWLGITVSTPLLGRAAE
jgi:hypothetical protein